MKKFCLIAFVLLVTFAFSDDALFVYKKVGNDIDESAPAAKLYKSDWIKELPIPPEKVKKVTWVKEKEEVLDLLLELRQLDRLVTVRPDEKESDDDYKAHWYRK